MSLKQITSVFLKKLDLDFEEKENKIILSINAKFNDSEFNSKMDLVFELKEKVNIVTLNYLTSLYFEDNNGFYQKLNEINAALEIGYLVALKVDDKSKTRGLLYRHDLNLWGTQNLMEKKQFDFLLSYMSFVKSIVNDELSEYMVDRDGEK